MEVALEVVVMSRIMMKMEVDSLTPRSDRDRGWLRTPSFCFCSQDVEQATANEPILPVWFDHAFGTSPTPTTQGQRAFSFFFLTNRDAALRAAIQLQRYHIPFLLFVNKDVYDIYFVPSSSFLWRPVKLLGQLSSSELDSILAPFCTGIELLYEDLRPFLDLSLYQPQQPLPHHHQGHCLLLNKLISSQKPEGLEIARAFAHDPPLTPDKALEAVFRFWQQLFASRLDPPVFLSRPPTCHRAVHALLESVVWPTDLHNYRVESCHPTGASNVYQVHLACPRGDPPCPTLNSASLFLVKMDAFGLALSVTQRSGSDTILLFQRTLPTNALPPIANEEYHDPYLPQNPFVAHHRTLLIQSPKGTGKTSRLFDYLKQRVSRCANLKVLVLSTRQSFARNFAHTFESLGFQNYLDYPSTHQLAQHPRIIISLESLRKLPIRVLEDCRIDVLVLDECESLLAHFGSSTMDDMRIRSWEALCNFSQEAKQVIALDADLSTRTIDFLKDVRTNSPLPHIVVNRWRPNRHEARKIFLYEFDRPTKDNFCSSEWLECLHRDLSAQPRRNLAVATNSKDFADKLADNLQHNFPQLTLCLVSSQSSDQEKIRMSTDVEKWKDFQVVMYTPTIGAGVDVNLPGWYHALYAFGCSKSNNARDFDQQMGRVRHINTGTIRLCLPSWKGQQDSVPKKPVTFSEIRQMSNEQLAEVKGCGKEMLARGLTEFGWQLEPSPYTTQFLYRVQEKNISGCQFATALVARLIANGDSMVIEPAISAQSAPVQQQGSLTEDRLVRQLATHPPFADKQQYDLAKEREKKSDASSEDRLGIRRWELCLTLGISPTLAPLPLQLVEHFHTARSQNQFNLYKQLLRDHCTLFLQDLARFDSGRSFLLDELQVSPCPLKAGLHVLLEAMGFTNGLLSTERVFKHKIEENLEHCSDLPSLEQLRKDFSLPPDPSVDISLYDRVKKLVSAILELVGCKLVRDQARLTGSRGLLSRYHIQHGIFLEFAYVSCADQDMRRTLDPLVEAPFQYESLHGILPPNQAQLVNQNKKRRRCGSR